MLHNNYTSITYRTPTINEAGREKQSTWGRWEREERKGIKSGIHTPTLHMESDRPVGVSGLSVRLVICAAVIMVIPIHLS